MSAKHDDDFKSGFEAQGFLAPEMQGFTNTLRAEARAWFDLVDDLSASLTRMTFRNTSAAAVDQKSFEQKPVSHAVLLRGTANLQGAVLMAERGMVSQARALARSVLEDAFCMAGLHDQPEVLLQHLRTDHDLSRKGKAKAVLVLGDEHKYDAKALKKLIAEMPKMRNLGVNEVAMLGPLSKLYLAYKVLSDDGSHPTVTTLARHLNFSADRASWNGFFVGPGKTREIVESLNFALLAALPLGVGYTNIIGDTVGNDEMALLSERYHNLPSMEEYD